MSYVTKKEKCIATNGLVCLIQSLQGIQTTVDMRNESSATGIIKEVDGFMNVLLQDVQFEDVSGNIYFYETLYIKNRNIRYIHIPKHISVKDAIHTFLQKSKNKKEEPTNLQRYRARKLQEKQEKTRAQIEQLKLNKPDPSKSSNKN